MSGVGWLQIAFFAALIVALARPVGDYLYRVYEGPIPLPRWLGPVERLAFRVLGVEAGQEQTAFEYSASLLSFGAVSVLVPYTLLRWQGHLPQNPQGLPGVEPGLAWNTAVSFATNTDWQSYAGESTLGYLAQMVALTWQNFVSAAAGMGVALAVVRGLTRDPAPGGPGARQTLGSFWVDLVRGTLYVLLPLSVLFALAMVSQGVLQTLAPSAVVHLLDGGSQTVALGPVASQEAIKMLGTNGGGYFNANSAHPFENPTPLVDLLQMLAIFVLPAGLTLTYGRMARSRRQGWALFGAMGVLFLAGVAATYAAEARPNPAFAGLPVETSAGNLEGKELRFGVAASALFATVTTDASCGAVNAMHDSYTPLGGLVPMVNIALGEIIFGGVGAGLYGMLVFVLLSVFIAGLMVGRSPELLGRKVEAREMKLAMIYVLVFPLLVLGSSGWAAVHEAGTSSLANAGPHGLSEILYAYLSAGGNNGSAFAGLNANTPYWNISLGVVMLGGRFLMMVPVLALAGSMRGKRRVPPGLGTFPTDGLLFTGLLVGVVVIVGALTFFPALALGPIVEHLLAQAGRSY